jgi:thioesterase DpgC
MTYEPNLVLTREAALRHDLASPWARVIEQDAATLSLRLAEGEWRLAQLTPKRLRDDREQLLAEQIGQDCRDHRQAFMRQHAREVYGIITEGREGHCALSELAYSAAEHFPGLVPTRARIAHERTLLQRDKDGLERDQGVFFSELLRRPEIGADLVLRMLRPSATALALLPAFQRDGHIQLGKVDIERRGTAAHLTVTNPACLNAEDDELIDQMETAVDLALLDDAVLVALLRGGLMSHPRYRGRRVFSAGINLKELHRGQISYADFLLRREFGYINKMAHGLRLPATLGDERSIEKPWVAAVDAFAIGGGAQILLVCDHVIASEESYFSLPAAQEGIVPGVANLRLPQLAGARLARQIILLGRRVWAREPDAACLFDQVVADSAMDAAIETVLAQLASPAVIPNRRAIGVCEEPLERFRLYMAQFATEQATRMYSRDVLDKVGRV